MALLVIAAVGLAQDTITAPDNNCRTSKSLIAIAEYRSLWALNINMGHIDMADERSEQEPERKFKGA